MNSFKFVFIIKVSDKVVFPVLGNASCKKRPESTDVLDTVKGVVILKVIVKLCFFVPELLVYYLEKSFAFCRKFGNEFVSAEDF